MEIIVIFCVLLYFFGDNFNDISEKRRSSIMIISALIGIYFFSSIYEHINDWIAKEDTKEENLERGIISKSQRQKKKNNDRNAKNYKKLYKFILQVFGIIPILDGLYSALLDTGDACDSEQVFYYNALWILYGVIMFLLLLRLPFHCWNTITEIIHQEVKIEQVRLIKYTAGAKIKNLNGNVTSSGGTEHTSGKCICKTKEISNCQNIAIKEGATWSENEEVTIRGETITITGGTITGGTITENNQLKYDNGTTIIKNGEITTTKGDVVLIDGATRNGENNDRNRGKIVHHNKKSTTIETSSEIILTANHATVIGGKITKFDPQKSSHYNGAKIENKWCLLIIVTVVSILAYICTGTFLVADNIQPLNCTSNTANANYGIRLGFMLASLICYSIAMVMALIFWFYSNCCPTQQEQPPNQQEQPPNQQEQPLTQQESTI